MVGIGTSFMGAVLWVYFYENHAVVCLFLNLRLSFFYRAGTYTHVSLVRFAQIRSCFTSCTTCTFSYQAIPSCCCFFSSSKIIFIGSVLNVAFGLYHRFSTLNSSGIVNIFSSHNCFFFCFAALQKHWPAALFFVWAVRVWEKHKFKLFKLNMLNNLLFLIRSILLPDKFIAPTNKFILHAKPFYMIVFSVLV